MRTLDRDQTLARLDYQALADACAAVLASARPAGDGPLIFKSVGQSLWDLAAGRVLVDAG